jgi:hypothetical protein
VRIAFRRRWQRQLGNDATARVAVPVTVLDGNRKPPPLDVTHDAIHGARPQPFHDARPQSSHDRSLLVSGLTTAVEILREQLVVANSGREAAEAARDRADQALSGERSRADALRDRLNAAMAELAEAKKALDAADQLRATAAARRAAGLLARLLAAWRGE